MLIFQHHLQLVCEKYNDCIKYISLYNLGVQTFLNRVEKEMFRDCEMLFKKTKQSLDMQSIMKT